MTPVTVVAFVDDLMDRSRLQGIEGIAFTSDPSRCATADVVIVDLARGGQTMVVWLHAPISTSPSNQPGDPAPRSTTTSTGASMRRCRLKRNRPSGESVQCCVDSFAVEPLSYAT